MCGIAGVIHKNGPSDIGAEITLMLQAMKHRGPDSTGFALYGQPTERVVMRIKLADPNAAAEDRLRRAAGAPSSRARGPPRQGRSHDLDRIEIVTNYACRVELDYEGDLKALVDYVEDIPDAEVLSIGHSLEIVKDLGDAVVSRRAVRPVRLSGARTPSGTCGWRRSRTSISPAPTRTGPTRSPTSRSCTTASSRTTTSGAAASSTSGTVSSRSATRRSSPSTWPSSCTTTCPLETAIKQSLDDFDGVFTYVVVTKDSLGVAKDVMAAKPLVLFESDDVVALASEEVAIRAADRSRDRHLRPLRGGGARVEQVVGSARSATTPAGSSNRTRRSRRSPRSTATRPCSTRRVYRPARSTSSCGGCSPR